MVPLERDFDSWAETYDEDVEREDWIHTDYEGVLKLVVKISFPDP